MLKFKSPEGEGFSKVEPEDSTPEEIVLLYGTPNCADREEEGF